MCVGGVHSPRQTCAQGEADITITLDIWLSCFSTLSETRFLTEPAAWDWLVCKPHSQALRLRHVPLVCKNWFLNCGLWPFIGLWNCVCLKILAIVKVSEWSTTKNLLKKIYSVIHLVLLQPRHWRKHPHTHTWHRAGPPVTQTWSYCVLFIET